MNKVHGDSGADMGGYAQSENAQTVGGNQVVTLTLEAYLNGIFREVEENLEYITEVEGIEIPKVWQEKILDPIAFAIAVIQADDTVTDLEFSDGSATTAPVESANQNNNLPKQSLKGK